MKKVKENTPGMVLAANGDANGDAGWEHQSKCAGGAAPKSQPSVPDYISKVDVALRFGKSVRTIEQWMHNGYLPHIKLGKGRRATVLFKWADIETHLKSKFGVGHDSI